jgi:hypothetical protein
MGRKPQEVPSRTGTFGPSCVAFGPGYRRGQDQGPHVPMRRLTISMLAGAAALLAAGSPAVAASCNGNAHEIVLSNGRATPGTGTTSTAIRFSVHYADSAGCAPSRVVVVVQGVGTYALRGSGSDYTAGATFSGAIGLPAGGHAYSFTASSGKKTGTLSSVSPSMVMITAPTPRPTATPTPPPPPPTAQPAPAAPPPAAPHPTSATATAVPTPRATPKPKPTADAANPRPDRSPDSPGAVSPSGAAIDGWWLAMQGRAHQVRSGSATTRTPSNALAIVPELQPTLDGFAPFGMLASFGLTTVAGLALFFILLRYRRNDGLVSPPLMTAPVPLGRASAVASPVHSDSPAPMPETLLASGEADAGRVSALPPMRELIPPIDYDLLRDPDVRVGPAAHEEGIPRWLRPSVREGRFGEEQRRRRDWGD